MTLVVALSFCVYVLMQFNILKFARHRADIESVAARQGGRSQKRHGRRRQLNSRVEGLSLRGRPSRHTEVKASNDTDVMGVRD